MQKVQEYRCHLIQRIWLREPRASYNKSVDQFTCYD